MEVLVHHAERVQKMYDAFNRGDKAYILSVLHQDCIWEVMGAPEIPFAGIYHGPEDIRGFFDRLNMLVEFKEMVPEQIFQSGNLVVAVGHWKAVIRKTNKPIGSQFATFDEFNDDGRLVHFRDCYDTLSVSKGFAK